MYVNVIKNLNDKRGTMKKSSLGLSLLLAVFIANQNCSAESPSFPVEDQVYGQNFLNIKLTDKPDSSFKTDLSMTGAFSDNSSRAQDDINIGVLPDYILKPQDEVNIDIWGSLNLHYVLTVSSDGYIVIPEAGRVALNGLTYSEAKKKILILMCKAKKKDKNLKNFCKVKIFPSSTLLRWIKLILLPKWPWLMSKANG